MNKKWIFIAVPTLVITLLVLLGVGTGHYLATYPFHRKISKRVSSESMGKLLSSKKREELAKVYHPREDLLSAMDSFSWNVANTVTPFVGNGPRPGKSANAHINNLQCRSSREIIFPKPKNVIRIFLTGGSTAYGSGAPSEETTVGGYLENLLQRNLNKTSEKKYEVFTLATPAWASTHERIAIENRISEWEPDLVISLSGVNDVHWGRLGNNSLWFQTYEDEFFSILLNNAHKKAGYPPLIDVSDIEENPVSPSLVAQRLHKNIILSTYVLSLSQVPYVFFLQPSLALTQKKLSSREQKLLRDQKYFTQCYQEIAQKLSKVPAPSFHFSDLRSVFDSLPSDNEIFLDSYHFGDKGNQIIAQAMFEFLAETNLFSQ